MQIGKKGYPYPILNNAKNFNCYKNETYSLELEELEEVIGEDLGLVNDSSSIDINIDNIEGLDEIKEEIHNEEEMQEIQEEVSKDDLLSLNLDDDFDSLSDINIDVPSLEDISNKEKDNIIIEDYSSAPGM